MSSNKFSLSDTIETIEPLSISSDAPLHIRLEYSAKLSQYVSYWCKRYETLKSTTAEIIWCDLAEDFSPASIKNLDFDTALMLVKFLLSYGVFVSHEDVADINLALLNCLESETLEPFFGPLDSYPFGKFTRPENQPATNDQLEQSIDEKSIKLSTRTSATTMVLPSTDHKFHMDMKLCLPRIGNKKGTNITPISSTNHLECELEFKYPVYDPGVTDCSSDFDDYEFSFENNRYLKCTPYHRNLSSFHQTMESNKVQEYPTRLLRYEIYRQKCIYNLNKPRYYENSLAVSARLVHDPGIHQEAYATYVTNDIDLFFLYAFQRPYPLGLSPKKTLQILPTIETFPQAVHIRNTASPHLKEDIILFRMLLKIGSVRLIYDPGIIGNPIKLSASLLQKPLPNKNLVLEVLYCSHIFSSHLEKSCKGYRGCSYQTFYVLPTVRKTFVKLQSRTIPRIWLHVYINLLSYRQSHRRKAPIVPNIHKSSNSEYVFGPDLQPFPVQNQTMQNMQKDDWQSGPTIVELLRKNTLRL